MKHKHTAAADVAVNNTTGACSSSGKHITAPTTGDNCGVLV
jgi:hypothetical protein